MLASWVRYETLPALFPFSPEKEWDYWLFMGALVFGWPGVPCPPNRQLLPPTSLIGKFLLAKGLGSELVTISAYRRRMDLRAKSSPKS